ncbi:MAG: sulfite exporter TauE/SafE family protein [Rickettsiales bacterium]|nr:sulfite exporter TauE/SafE family protein [Rickettsiales bacterium]
MQVYLPIAEVSVNILTMLSLGGAVGVLSGLFGIGGGFLTTPFLILLGINPAIAVASSANQIVAASLSGFYAHWARRNVDFRMGTLLLIGGLIGSTGGVFIFQWLKTLGQIDLVISLLYVVFLGSIGSLMAIESLQAMLGKKKKKKKVSKTPLSKRLPWQMEFPRSKLTISAWLPLLLGLAVGVLVSIMGVGGGFFMIPAMIYLLGMPTSVVIGTSLFQIMFITINVTFLHAVTTQTVDLMLAVLLLLGSATGAQIGSRLGAKLPADKLRGLLAVMVLAVAIKLGMTLFTPPENIYSMSVEEVR